MTTCRSLPLSLLSLYLSLSLFSNSAACALSVECISIKAFDAADFAAMRSSTSRRCLFIFLLASSSLHFPFLPPPTPLSRRLRRPAMSLFREDASSAPLPGGSFERVNPLDVLARNNDGRCRTKHANPRDRRSSSPMSPKGRAERVRAATLQQCGRDRRRLEKRGGDGGVKTTTPAPRSSSSSTTLSSNPPQPQRHPLFPSAAPAQPLTAPALTASPLSCRCGGCGRDNGRCCGGGRGRQWAGVCAAAAGGRPQRCRARGQGPCWRADHGQRHPRRRGPALRGPRRAVGGRLAAPRAADAQAPGADNLSAVRPRHQPGAAQRRRVPAVYRRHPQLWHPAHAEPRLAAAGSLLGHAHHDPGRRQGHVGASCSRGLGAGRCARVVFAPLALACLFFFFLSLAPETRTAPFPRPAAHHGGGV